MQDGIKRKNMKKLIFTLLMALAMATGITAQTSFQVIPPRNVIAGNTFYVTYRLTNGAGNGLDCPAVTGCKLLSPRPGVSTMQSVEIINGHQSSTTTVDYTYTYRAEKEGTYTVPAASIQQPASGGRWLRLRIFRRDGRRPLESGQRQDRERRHIRACDTQQEPCLRR